MAITEVYERLRTGVVDGSLVTPALFAAYKFNEVAKNLIMVGLGARASLSMAFNLKKWNQLPPDVQKLFTDVGKEVQKRHAEETDAKLGYFLKLLQDSGVTYYGYLSNEDRKKWASMVPDTVASTNKRLEGQYPQVWDMSDRFIELAKQKGYVWPLKLNVR